MHFLKTKKKWYKEPTRKNDTKEFNKYFPKNSSNRDPLGYDNLNSAARVKKLFEKPLQDVVTDLRNT